MSNRRLPRRLRIAAAVVAVAVATGAGWYGWASYTTPLPPAVPLKGLDPDVAVAIAKARRKVLDDSHSGVAYGELGKVLRANGFERASNECFAQAEHFEPDEPRWPYYQGATLAFSNPEAALPFLRRAVELADKYDRDNDAPRLLLAETLLRTGAYAQAAERLDLARDPDNPRVHYDLGLLAVMRQDDETAARHFILSAASPYARQKSYSDLASIRQRQGDAAAAEQFSRQARTPPTDQSWENNDKYVREYFNLVAGRQRRSDLVASLLRAGRPQEALPILQDLAQDASDPQAQIAAGQAMLQLGRTEDAERYLRAAVGLGTDQAEANCGLALVLYTEGAILDQQGENGPLRAEEKYREAAAFADRALELKPGYAMAYLYRGLALVSLGRKQDALASFRRAAQLRPEMEASHMNLGLVLADIGQGDEAIAQFQQACDLAVPGDTRPHEELVRVRERFHKPR